MDTSDRFRWLEQVRQREERRQRTAELRTQLAIARAEGKRRRHKDRLARLARSATTPKEAR